MKKFFIGKSRFGRGCFAKQEIKEGEIICVLSGRKLSNEEVDKEILLGNVRLDDPLQIAENTYLILEKESNYFNHSCNPNAGITRISTLVAIKTIKEGEEIFYDYSTTVGLETDKVDYDFPDKEWQMICLCRSNNCRNIIGNIETLPESTLRRYSSLGVLPDFIKRQLNLT